MRPPRDVAGAEPVPELRQAAQLPEPALDASAPDHGRPPPARHEAGRRIIGRIAAVGDVHLAQELERLEQGRTAGTPRKVKLASRSGVWRRRWA